MTARPMTEHNKSGQATRPVFMNNAVSVCPQNILPAPYILIGFINDRAKVPIVLPLEFERHQVDPFTTVALKFQPARCPFKKEFSAVTTFFFRWLFWGHIFA